MRILYITRKNLIPANSGDTIIALEMLQQIKSEKNNIDLVNFIDSQRYSENEKQYLSNYCENIYEVPKKNKRKFIYYIISTLISRKSFSTYQMYCKTMEELIIKLDKENHYDIIYFDHLHMGQYIRAVKQLTKSYIVLNEHNVEYTIWKRKIEECRNPIFKYVLGVHMNRLKKEEEKYCSLANVVYAISEEDKEELDNMGLKNVLYKKPLSNFDSIKAKDELEHFNYNIMFMGSMDWHPNEEAVEWFVNNVIPNISDKYTFYIVGKNPTERVLKLASERVKVTGRVKSVDEYIKRCDIFVVPMFVGGGVKIKLIEALAKGIPVISTTFGMKGIKVSNENEVIIADTSKDFIKAIEKLECDNKLRINLYEHGRQFYEQYNVMEDYVKELFCLNQ